MANGCIGLFLFEASAPVLNRIKHNRKLMNAEELSKHSRKYMRR